MNDHELSENWVAKFKEKFFSQELLPIWQSQNLKVNDGTWNYFIDYTKKQAEESVKQKINESTSLY
jgi:hypothetical protein